MRKIRIGSGAGFSDDGLFPALELMKKGDLDYISFECLAERTIAIAQQQKKRDPSKGYNGQLEFRMKHVLPLAQKNGIKVITNMGAANVEAAVAATAEIARELGLKGLKIAGVLGDDILPMLDRYQDLPIMETGQRLGDFDRPLVSANVYLGSDGIVEALKQGADVVITGRCNDAALFLAPLIHEFGWSTDELLGTGTLVGHLLECSAYITGGNYCIPGVKEAPELWNLGYPIAEVFENGDIFLSKLPDTGGALNRHTCIEQLLYEIHDPARYIVPDCVADFSGVDFVEVGKDCVQVIGATGYPRTDTLKVSIGYTDGVIGITETSFGGPYWKECCDLYFEIARRNWARLGLQAEEAQFSIIGYNSLCPDVEHMGFDVRGIPEGRGRIAVRAKDRETAAALVKEANGGLGCPAGATLFSQQVKDVLAVLSLLIPRADVSHSVIYQEVDR